MTTRTTTRVSTRTQRRSLTAARLSAPAIAPERLPLAVDPAEAARLLSLCRTSVYSLLKTKELTSFTVGARRLIPMSALEAWVARQTSEAAASADEQESA